MNNDDTFHSIAREYFSHASEELLEHIMWEETGYPNFWRIPEDGNTPEECFRKQLEIYADIHTWIRRIRRNKMLKIVLAIAYTIVAIYSLYRMMNG